MENVLLVAYFSLFLVAVLQVGSWLVRWFRFPTDNSTEAGVFAFALGAIFYSYFFHLLGALHLLYAPLLFAGYLVPVLVWIGQLMTEAETRKSLWSWFASAQVSKLTSPAAILTLIVLAFVFFPIVPYQFLYPASWDVLAYHLPLPKFYLAQHGLPFAAWFAQTGFPIGIEALFGYGEVWHEPRVSHLIHFAFIVTTVVYLLHGLKDRFSLPVRWLATGLFLFQPLIYSEVALSAFVDYPFAFYTLLTSWALIKFYQTRQPATLVVTAVLVGFLPLIKFSGLLVGVSFGLMMLGVLWQIVGQRQDFNLNKYTKGQWLLLLGGLTTSLWWFMRTAYYTGNPFYPFYNDVFKGLGYEAHGKTVLKDDILLNSFVWQMMRSFRTTMDTIQDYVNLSAILFLMVGTVAMLFFLRSKKSELRILAVFHLLIFLLLMMSIGPITRYVFFIFPGLSLLIASLVFVPAASFRKKATQRAISRSLLHGGYCFLVMVTAFVLIDSTFHTRRNIYLDVHKRHWLNFMNPKTARSMLYQQDNYPLQTYANTHLDPLQVKVLQVLDNRVYYLDVPAEFANTIVGGYFTNLDDERAGDVYLRVKADGFTHVIKLDAWGAHPVMNGKIFNDFMNQYVTPIATESGVTLYKIDDH